MSISILNRGASGGLKPELTVIAPSGSTIDLLQNGIIIDTYNLGASETEHTFVVKVGTYTVRGTLGTKVQSEEIAIDVVGRYVVEIDYKLWLYREGDECVDVTGGWVNGFTQSGGTYTENADNFYLYVKGRNFKKTANTSNKVDMSGFSKIYAHWKWSASNATYCAHRFAIGTATPDWSWESVSSDVLAIINVWEAGSNVDEVVSLDIPSGTTDAYVQFGVQTNNASYYSELYLYECWLE